MEGSQDGALAEFAALRQEILNRSTAQQNVLALQLSTSGALFALARRAGGDHVQRLFDVVLLEPHSGHRFRPIGDMRVSACLFPAP
jgi:hypothetical protein